MAGFGPMQVRAPPEPNWSSRAQPNNFAKAGHVTRKGPFMLLGYE
jgi:hypothetical protein